MQRQLDASPPPPPTASPGCPPPAPNPYIQRILDIRETVTLNKRIPFVATRLRKCMTRTGLCQWHCILGLVLGVVLGLLFYQLPETRAGIEKRENLFHVIVQSISFVLCSVLFASWRESLLPYLIQLIFPSLHMIILVVFVLCISIDSSTS